MVAEQRHLIEILAQVKEERDKALEQAKRALGFEQNFMVTPTSFERPHQARDISDSTSVSSSSAKSVTSKQESSILRLLDEYTRLREKLVREVHSEEYNIQSDARVRLEGRINLAHRSERRRLQRTPPKNTDVCNLHTRTITEKSAVSKGASSISNRERNQSLQLIERYGTARIEPRSSKIPILSKFPEKGPPPNEMKDCSTFTLDTSKSKSPVGKIPDGQSGRRKVRHFDSPTLSDMSLKEATENSVRRRAPYGTGEVLGWEAEEAESPGREAAEEFTFIQKRHVEINDMAQEETAAFNTYEERLRFAEREAEEAEDIWAPQTNKSVMIETADSPTARDLRSSSIAAASFSDMYAEDKLEGNRMATRGSDVGTVPSLGRKRPARTFHPKPLAPRLHIPQASQPQTSPLLLSQSPPIDYSIASLRPSCIMSATATAIAHKPPHLNVLPVAKALKDWPVEEGDDYEFSFRQGEELELLNTDHAPGINGLNLVRRKGILKTGLVPSEVLELVGNQSLSQRPARLPLEANGRDIYVAEDRSPITEVYRSVSGISTKSSVSRLGASGLRVAEDQSPITEGHRSDSDISTNPSIIQGPMAGMQIGDQPLPQLHVHDWSDSEQPSSQEGFMARTADGTKRPGTSKRRMSKAASKTSVWRASDVTSLDQYISAQMDMQVSKGGDGKRVQKAPVPISCEICSKNFTRAYDLRAHLRTHPVPRPFKCDVCSEVFTHDKDLWTHKGAVHIGPYATRLFQPESSLPISEELGTKDSESDDVLISLGRARPVAYDEVPNSPSLYRSKKKDQSHDSSDPNIKPQPKSAVDATMRFEQGASKIETSSRSSLMDSWAASLALESKSNTRVTRYPTRLSDAHESEPHELEYDAFIGSKECENDDVLGPVPISRPLGGDIGRATMPTEIMARRRIRERRKREEMERLQREQNEGGSEEDTTPSEFGSSSGGNRTNQRRCYYMGARQDFAAQPLPTERRSVACGGSARTADLAGSQDYSERRSSGVPLGPSSTETKPRRRRRVSTQQSGAVGSILEQVLMDEEPASAYYSTAKRPEEEGYLKKTEQPGSTSSISVPEDVTMWSGSKDTQTSMDQEIGSIADRLVTQWTTIEVPDLVPDPTEIPRLLHM